MRMEYQLLVKKIERVLENAKYGVFATSDKDGIVSASQDCLINIGLDVYIQTDRTFEKINNIKENKNVAIALGDYYFKGKAEILGHPIDFPKFIEIFKKKHPKSYGHYSSLTDEVLIKVVLTECRIWDSGLDNIQEISTFETVMNSDISKTEKPQGKSKILTIVDFDKKTVKNTYCEVLD